MEPDEFLAAFRHSLGTISACRLAFIPHSAIREIIVRRPGVAAAFWRETLIDASVFRERIVNVGIRDSRARIAHLFCELYARLQPLGLAKEDGFTLPLTQAEIADATRMSAVHVNRSLQELRRAGLVASEGRFLRILDLPGLQGAGGFDPAYLHAVGRAPADDSPGRLMHEAVGNATGASAQ